VNAGNQRPDRPYHRPGFLARTAIRNLWPYDDEYSHRARQVSFAALLQQISEYELFKRAHVRRRGSPIGDAALEALFVRYLFHGELPHWVEEYAMEVIREAWRADPGLIPVTSRVLGSFGALRCWYTDQRLRWTRDHAEQLVA
jgi:hypothetical protein